MNNMDNYDLKTVIKEAAKGNAILFGSNRELRRLPLYLHENEQIHKIVTGSPGKNKGRGIIVATNLRILFLKDGWILRTVQDFPYETMSSVEFQTRIFFGTLVIYGKGDERSYNWIGRYAGVNFTQIVSKLSSEYKYNPSKHAVANEKSSPTQEPAQAPQTPQGTIVEQLRTLEQLKTEGLISLDDYEIKKQDIYSRF